ncbi:MAG: hypothetical protein K2G39_13495, partial [Lachnospiraceae bacterium]|nr:hypothetical protein [Lachnospiraceae bacterium]
NNFLLAEIFKLMMAHPNPMHSKHILTALFKTTAASPLTAPYQMNAKAAAKVIMLTAVFFLLPI